MTPKPNEVQFTVNLSTDLLVRLAEMAKHADISRHRLIVNLLSATIDEVEKLEHVGILQLGILIRNMAEPMMAKFNRNQSDENISEMPIPLRIDKLLLERLERLADKGDITRQRLAQNIIKTGLEELEAARKYGLTHVIFKIRDMHDLLKDVLESGKRAFYAGKEVKSK